MEIEEKVKLFQGKLDNFFKQKSAEKGISKESIKLIVSFRENGTLRYEVWDYNNIFLGDEKLENIIHLNFLEKMLTSHETISEGLIQHMEKYAIANNMLKIEIALLLKPTHEYSVLKNRSKFKDILLNEIL